MHAVIEKSIRETVDTFLNNPSQFHGDTGIMHFLYHRMMTHAGDAVFHDGPNGTKCLLLQSEHYTTLPYIHKGSSSTFARMDYAFIDPQFIPPDGKLPKKKSPTMIGLEVGRNKAIEKMGDMEATQDCKAAKPGDAAKLIRELRFSNMQSAYLLEFYDNAEYYKEAKAVWQAVTKTCEGLSIKGLCFVLVMKGDTNAGNWVSVYPPEWAAELVWPYESLPEQSPATGTQEAGSFLDVCGPSNKALLVTLRREFSQECTWAKYSMTVRRPGVLWMRVTNQKHPNDEGIQEIHPQFADSLEKAGIDVVDGDCVEFPDGLDQGFVDRVIQALRISLQNVGPGPVQGASNYETFCASCGPCNRLLQRELRAQSPYHGTRCLWGESHTMTLRQKGRRPDALVVRITNTKDKQGERMQDIDPRLVEALGKQGIPVTSGRVSFPDAELEWQPFVDRVMKALLSVL